MTSAVSSPPATAARGSKFKVTDTAQNIGADLDLNAQAPPPLACVAAASTSTSVPRRCYGDRPCYAAPLG